MIEYTVTITNSDTVATQPDNPGDEFVDTVSSLSRIVGLPTVSPSGAGRVGIGQFGSSMDWNGSIGPNKTITIRFRVLVHAGLRGEPGEAQVCNQGQFFADLDLNGSNETPILSDDPGTAAMLGDATCLELSLRPPLPRELLRLTGVSLTRLIGIEGFRFWAQGTGIEQISVTIFSLTGKRIYASGWVENGHEWRLEDRAERKIANGVYLYVMTVRGYDEKSVKTYVKKLIIGR